MNVQATLRAMGFRGESKLSYTADDLASGTAEQAKQAVEHMRNAVLADQRKTA